MLTGTGAELAGADVLIQDGRIAAVGEGLAAPAGAEVVDAAGRWVTPGLIDVHSHLGVYPSPGIAATSDETYPLHPSTLGALLAARHRPRTITFEVRRDLLVGAFVPFVPLEADAARVAAVGHAIARGLHAEAERPV